MLYLYRFAVSKVVQKPASPIAMALASIVVATSHDTFSIISLPQLPVGNDCIAVQFDCR